MAVVERIVIRATANGPGIELQTAKVAPGGGIDGDRYANGTGSFYKPGKPGQDVTLIEAEALEDVGLTAADSGRNVVTRGIGLNDLVGKRFRIGDVELRGAELCHPCRTLRDRTGVFRELVGRGGLCADVLVAGELRPGDEIEVL
jgi:MOSC domain-containing protein YiiM